MQSRLILPPKVVNLRDTISSWIIGIGYSTETSLLSDERLVLIIASEHMRQVSFISLARFSYK